MITIPGRSESSSRRGATLGGGIGRRGCRKKPYMRERLRRVPTSCDILDATARSLLVVISGASFTFEARWHFCPRRKNRAIKSWFLAGCSLFESKSNCLIVFFVVCFLKLSPPSPIFVLADPHISVTCDMIIRVILIMDPTHGRQEVNESYRIFGENNVFQ